MKARRAGLSTVALFVGVFAGEGACSRARRQTPEEALTAWVNAMNATRSDVDARRGAFDLLSRRTRDSLALRAARASQLAGRTMQPWEMLAPGRFALRFAFEPDTLTSRVDPSGDRAVVVVQGPAREHVEVPMVREADQWRVELVLPPIEINAPSAAGSSGVVP